MRRNEVRRAAVVWIALGLTILALPASGRTTLAGAALSLGLDGPSAVSLGTNVTYWGNVSGGAPPYSFDWELNGTPIRSNLTNTSAGERWDFRPMGNGLFVLGLNVTDSAHNRTARQTYIDVTGASPLSVSLHTTPNSSAQGGVTIEATPSGGSSPYQFLWTGPGAPPSWTSSGSYTTPPLPSGSYHVVVQLRDAHGYTVSGSLELRVAVTSPGPSVAGYLWLGVGLLGGLALALAVLAIRRRQRRGGAGSPS